MYGIHFYRAPATARAVGVRSSLVVFCIRHDGISACAYLAYWALKLTGLRQ
jgi:hypothetical protein